MKSSTKNQPGEKDLKKEIEARIKEYDSAIEYFKSNEYKEDQIKKALDDKKILEESLEKINKGEKIDEKIIPKEITPEYINGYTNDERIKKYYEIIIKIIEEKKKLKDELNNEIKELKKLNDTQIISMEKISLLISKILKLKKKNMMKLLIY